MRDSTNYSMGTSDLDGMGGFLAVAVIVIGLIWAVLRDSDRKIKNNANAQKTANQQAATHQFKREFGENNRFDSSDFYIANRVVDYAKAGGNQLETITNVAGLLGTVKHIVAKESSQAAVKLLKDRMEQDKLNQPSQNIELPRQTSPVYLHPQHPAQYPERPIVIEPPRHRKRIYYDDPGFDDEYEYVPRRRRYYNHYS